MERQDCLAKSHHFTSPLAMSEASKFSTFSPMTIIRSENQRSQHQEDPLKEGTATRSSILAWTIPQAGKPGGLQSVGSQRVRHDCSSLAHTHLERRGDFGHEVCSQGSGAEFGRRCRNIPLTTPSKSPLSFHSRSLWLPNWMSL